MRFTLRINAWFWIVLFMSSLPLVASEKSGKGWRSLTFEERVFYQSAIEQVYWRHRKWPSTNKNLKPSLNYVMPHSAIVAKVQDYLKKSNSLAEFWKRPITPHQLQAEMDRMVRNTKQPEILRELFAALGNDPNVIAECLARPNLADRLIHNMFAGDERFHGALKNQIASELSRTNSPEGLRTLSGRYSEMEMVKSTGNSNAPSNGQIILDSAEWEEIVQNLENQISNSAARRTRTITASVSPLQEDPSRFYVVAVLAKQADLIKTAKVEWSKKSFEQWWAVERTRLSTQIVEEPFDYKVQSLSLSSSCVDDTWFNDGTALQGAPSARHLHTAVWTGNEMIVWGGNGGGNTGGRYNPAIDEWTATSLLDAPSDRYFHTAVWSGSEMIVWGGIGGDSTGGRYNPTTDTWTATNLTNAPGPRFLHTAVWAQDEMIIWGGLGDSSLNDGGRYNPLTDTWLPGGTSLINAPDPRRAHTAVWTGNEMIVWGGDDGSNFFNTGGRYNPDTDSWMPTSLLDAPIGRDLATAVWTQSRMIVWGGQILGGANTNTGGQYDPTNTWQPTSTVDAPSDRRSLTSVWTGTEMIIWGGEGSGQALNTGGRYNPITDTWVPAGTSLLNAPSGRIGSTVVWADTEMIIWGGRDINFSTINTGGRYCSAAPMLAQTTTTISSSANPSEFGQSVSFTAVVTSNTGSPSGAVTFTDGNTELGTELLDSSGQASYSTAALTGGIHSITATYTGDGNFAASTSYVLTQTVNQAPTAINLVSSINPSSFGQAVTFTATVSSIAGTPDGTVAFKDGTIDLGSRMLDSSGQASIVIDGLSPGDHNVTAVYSGSLNFATSTSLALTQTVNKAATTTDITSSPNPSFAYESVTFTATVTSSTGWIPAGTVTFKKGSTILGTAPLNEDGQSTLVISLVSTGRLNVTAVYSGDNNFLASTSAAVSQEVQLRPTITSLTSSQNPSITGQNVIFTVAVISSAGGTPTGTVTFKDGPKILATVPIDGAGQTTFNTSTLSKGKHKMTAVYNGDAYYASSASPQLLQTVN